MLKNISVLFIIFTLVMGLGAENTDVPEMPYNMKSMDVSSGVFSGVRGEEYTVAYRNVMHSADATWMRLYFDEHNLGEKSYVKITSLKDHAEQILNAEQLKVWDSSTAFFNGNRVLVELYVAGMDRNVFIHCSEIMSGDVISDRSICGGADDRIDSSDPASGRLAPTGCTGWIIQNAYLTAGHCVGNLKVLQFQVPKSNADGSLNHPTPQNQYPITKIYDSRNSGPGVDWCVFECGPNDTGKTPRQAQGSFFRISDTANPQQIRITGFGVDSMPTGSKGGNNKDSQTQQTHVGPFTRLQGTRLDYHTDTTGGNSGSPVISETEKVTVGIHTHGGCSSSSSSSNSGTSFTNRELMNTINSVSSATIFVDKNHTTSNQNGSILNPYKSITSAMTTSTVNNMINIAQGVYNENVTFRNVSNIISTGKVVIGIESEEVVAELNEEVRGSVELDLNGVALGKNFSIAEGATVVINTPFVILSSEVSLPENSVLQINIVK